MTLDSKLSNIYFDFSRDIKSQYYIYQDDIYRQVYDISMNNNHIKSNIINDLVLCHPTKVSKHINRGYEVITIVSNENDLDYLLMDSSDLFILNFGNLKNIEKLNKTKVINRIPTYNILDAVSSYGFNERRSQVIKIIENITIFSDIFNKDVLELLDELKSLKTFKNIFLFTREFISDAFEEIDKINKSNRIKIIYRPYSFISSIVDSLAASSISINLDSETIYPFWSTSLRSFPLIFKDNFFSKTFKYLESKKDLYYLLRYFDENHESLQGLISLLNNFNFYMMEVDVLDVKSLCP